MQERMKNWKVFDYVLLVIFAFYLTHLLTSFLNVNYDHVFGYSDQQAHWESTNDLLRGKLLYKDFFWEYGFLTLFLRAPFFLILGRTFFANIFSDLIVLPLIGIVLSYFVIKQWLSKWGLALCMSLLFLFGTNNDFNAIRHLIPELGLIFLMLGLEKNNHRQIVIGSIALALSLISSVEYALVAHVWIFMYLSYRMLKKKISFQSISPFLIAEGLVGGVFFLYLAITRTLGDFFQFHLSYASSFFTISPCTDVFFRLYNFETAKEFIPSINRLNYYILPLFIVGMIIWVLLQRKLKYKTILLILLGFSLTVFIRVVASPCYMHYGLLFPIIILCYFLFHLPVNKIMKIILIVFVAWFAITSSLKYISQTTGPKNSSSNEKVYFAKAGIYLPKEHVEDYEETTDYITENTRPDDYIFVYPHGPYYELSDRKNAIDLMSIQYYQFAPYLFDRAYKKLVDRKPELIILNIHNAPHYLDSVQGIRYNIYAQGDRVIFDGLTTDIENYISQWYYIEKMNKVSWILKRRNHEVNLIPYFIQIPQTSNWQIETGGTQKMPEYSPEIKNYSITADQAYFLLMSPDLEKGNLVKIPVKVDLGPLQNFRKFGLFYGLMTNKKQMAILGAKRINSDWDVHWINLPKKNQLPPEIKISAVLIQMSKNEGFLPGGIPAFIDIKQPEIYIINPDIHIDKRAFN